MKIRKTIFTLTHGASARAASVSSEADNPTSQKLTHCSVLGTPPAVLTSLALGNSFQGHVSPSDACIYWNDLRNNGLRLERWLGG